MLRAWSTNLHLDKLYFEIESLTLNGCLMPQGWSG